jgi:hypothetical protein
MEEVLIIIVKVLKEFYIHQHSISTITREFWLDVNLRARIARGAKTTHNKWDGPSQTYSHLLFIFLRVRSFCTQSWQLISDWTHQHWGKTKRSLQQEPVFFSTVTCQSEVLHWRLLRCELERRFPDLSQHESLWASLRCISTLRSWVGTHARCETRCT